MNNQSLQDVYVFDFKGVLVNFPKNTPEILNSVKPGLYEVFKKDRKTYYEEFTEVTSSLIENGKLKPQLIDGAEHVLKELDPSYIMVYNSIGGKVVEVSLRITGLEKYVNEIISGQKFGNKKKPESFEKLSDYLISQNKLLKTFCDDAEEHVVAASKGVKVLGFRAYHFNKSADRVYQHERGFIVIPKLVNILESL